MRLRSPPPSFRHLHHAPLPSRGRLIDVILLVQPLFSSRFARHRTTTTQRSFPGGIVLGRGDDRVQFGDVVWVMERFEETDDRSLVIFLGSTDALLLACRADAFDRRNVVVRANERDWQVVNRRKVGSEIVLGHGRWDAESGDGGIIRLTWRCVITHKSNLNIG